MQDRKACKNKVEMDLIQRVTKNDYKDKLGGSGVLEQAHRSWKPLGTLFPTRIQWPWIEIR